MVCPLTLIAARPVGRHDRHVTQGLFAQQVQQGRLACASPAGDKHMLITAFNQRQGALKVCAGIETRAD